MVNPVIAPLIPPLRRLCVGTTLLLAGCTSLGNQPDYLQLARTEPSSVQPWQTDANLAEAGTTSLNQLLESAQLDRLIEQALAANPSLQQTLITLQIRAAEQRQTLGQRLPQVEADLTGERSQNQADAETTIDTRYTGSLNISWEIDLWGRLADLDEASRHTLQQQTYLLQAARDSLVAQVAQSWIELVSQDKAIAIQQARVDSLQQTVALVEQRYRLGLGNREDLDSAAVDLSSALASLSAEQESQQQMQRALLVLLGSFDSTQLARLPQEYPTLPEPLVTLPEQTLAHRPDLQAAYAAIAAADKQRQAAYKDLLPSFSLTAALSDSATTPRQALLTDPLWLLLGQLSAPLFRGGQLRAAADIADLNVAQAYQDYRQTLLTAVTEVENALGQERALQRQFNHVNDALIRAQRNLTQYRAKYRAGLVELLDLLTVQRQVFDLQSQLNQLHYQQLTNRVDLSLALGLSWQDISASTDTHQSLSIPITHDEKTAP